MSQEVNPFEVIEKALKLFSPPKNVNVMEKLSGEARFSLAQMWNIIAIAMADHSEFSKVIKFDPAKGMQGAFEIVDNPYATKSKKDLTEKDKDVTAVNKKKSSK